MKNKNKKGLLLILLLLIGISGFIGYGVYSYYYTRGTVHTGTDDIHITSFNPTVYALTGPGPFGFLHGEHHDLSTTYCTFVEYDSNLEQAVYNCEAYFLIFNQGSTPISVVAENVSLNYDCNDPSNISVSNQTISYNGNQNNVAAKGGGVGVDLSATVTISNVSNDPSSVSSEAQYTSSAIYGANMTSIFFSVDVTATEVHD